MHVAYTFFRKKSIRNYITWRICSHHYNSLCDYMRRSDCGVFNNNTAAQPTVWRTKRTARHLQTIAFIILTLFSRSPLSPSLPNTTCSCLPSSLHSFRTPGISPIAKKKGTIGVRMQPLRFNALLSSWSLSVIFQRLKSSPTRFTWILCR